MRSSWQHPASILSHRLGWAAGLIALVVALVWWGLPALQRSFAPRAVPVLDSDVCLVAPPTPYDAASGQPLHAARAVPADARCPVCGMFPERSPDWAAQVIFANGYVHFFDSPVSLFMYLNDVSRYSPGLSAHDIVARYVTDVSSKSWIDAGSAYFVHGSSAKGPMRAGNLPAFATRGAAQQFAAQRGGEVRSFGAIDPAMVRQLGGQSSHRH